MSFNDTLKTNYSVVRFLFHDFKEIKAWKNMILYLTDTNISIS